MRLEKATFHPPSRVRCTAKWAQSWITTGAGEKVVNQQSGLHHHPLEIDAHGVHVLVTDDFSAGRACAVLFVTAILSLALFGIEAAAEQIEQPLIG